MKRILVPTESGADWRRLLAEPEKHWKAGRSAMCTAASWEAADPKLPPEISAALNGSGDPRLADLELLLAVPEWQVDLPGGARPTQTDVMALCRNERGLVVLAVEAKVDEAFGPTVAAKRAEASSGQSERITYLEQLLELTGKATDSLRYQLLHRTAAAVLTARAFHAGTAVMLVLSFGGGTTLQGDYRAFAGALGSTDLDASVMGVPGRTEPRLFVGWVEGEARFAGMDLR